MRTDETVISRILDALDRLFVDRPFDIIEGFETKKYILAINLCSGEVEVYHPKELPKDTTSMKTLKSIPVRIDLNLGNRCWKITYYNSSKEGTCIIPDELWEQVLVNQTLKALE